MRIRVYFTLGLVGLMAWFSAAEHSSAAIYNHNEDGRKTRLYIPDHLTNVRGLLVLGNWGSADATRLVNRPHYQEFARQHGFGFLLTGHFTAMYNQEQYDAWLSHVDALALKSGHPEIVHAPLAPIGFSNGGSMSYNFNIFAPEKTIGFVINKSMGIANDLPGDASLKTPGLFITGELDSEFTSQYAEQVFLNNRARNAPWAWIEIQNKGHQSGELELILPFMSELIRRRYPKDQHPTATSGVTLRDVNEEDGWLVDQNTWRSGLTDVYAYGDAPVDPTQLGWLPSQGLANAYRAVSTYDKLAVLSSPGLNVIEEDGPIELEFQVELPGAEWHFLEVFDGARRVYFEEQKDIIVFEPEAVAIPAGVPIRPFALELDGGFHTLTALVTMDDGTVHTSNLSTWLIAPEPASGVMLLCLSALLCRRRRLTA